MENNLHIETLLANTPSVDGGGIAPVTGAIYQTSSFINNGKTPYSYTRCDNPTRSALEEKMCLLDGGVRAFAFASGLAAVTARTVVVRKFPSARRGSDAAAGFASAGCSSFLAFSLACSIVIQVSDVVALHSNSVLVPAQPESNKVPSRGINKEICFIVPHLSHRSSQNHSSNP